MHVIARKALLDFSADHSDAYEPLDRWFRRTKSAGWLDFADLKQDFPSVDVYKNLTIFDIRGNDYRLIAEVNYLRGKVFIREVLTHKEYDRDAWKTRWSR